MNYFCLFYILIIIFYKYCYCIYNDFGDKNIWIVQIQNFSINDILQFAEENGFTFINQVTGFPDYYVLQHHTDILLSAASKRSGLNKLQLENDNRILWASKQMELKRDKRYSNYWKNMRNIQNLRYSNQELTENELFQNTKPLFNDELWEQEWYMQDKIYRNGLPKLDLNVLPVYKKGITGRGVRISVLDDGLEYTHDDLFPNYDPEISWDCNSDTADPTPNSIDKYNNHGTRCAGEIAMVANNLKCGVGIAFGANIGGIKLLGGRVYDLIEGMALGFAYDKVDIYSSSWGPTDDGKSLEGPGPLAVKAMERGIKEGRQGKGVIYVWASGNGGSRGDNCNCDGYASSIYTIAVGSASQKATMPWYGEMCSALLTVAYSSGSHEDKMIATTDTGNSCTVRHTGTSASAPLTAGIIALGLEANPNLTWRDVQHLIVRTANYEALKNNEGWQKNKANLYYNIRFGFGLMNANDFVNRAMNWTNVPAQRIDYVITHTRLPLQLIGPDGKSIVAFQYYSQKINKLEHIQVKLDLTYTIRGDLEFYLTSPGGTKIQLLGRRIKDKSNHGFRNWTLMSVGTWSENPQGLWNLTIMDSNFVKHNNSGQLLFATLILYGIHEQRHNFKTIDRKL